MGKSSLIPPRIPWFFMEVYTENCPLNHGIFLGPKQKFVAAGGHHHPADLTRSHMLRATHAVEGAG